MKAKDSSVGTMLRQNSRKILFLLALLWFGMPASASTEYVCEQDGAGLQAAHQRGKVIVRIHSYSSCSGGRRYELRAPSSSGSTLVCEPTTYADIPSGFVRIDLQKEPYNCNPYTGQQSFIKRNGFTIKKPTTSSSGEDVCTTPHRLPSGYIINQYKVDGTRCSPETSDKGQVRLKRATANTENRCAYPSASVPPGYVVSNIYNGSSCRPFANQSTDYSEQISVLSSTGTSYVCGYSGTYIPDGYAIVSESQSSSCARSGSGTRYTVKPFNGQAGYICAATANSVPDGYIATKVETGHAMCQSGSSLYVKVPSSSSTTIACSVGTGGFIVPPGYIVTRVDSSTSSVCDNNLDYTLKKPSSSSEFACAGFPVPDGWGATSSGTSSTCGGISGSGFVRLTKIQDGSGTYDICANAPVPEGFVIFEVKDTSACQDASDGLTYSIKKPSTSVGTETLACGASTEIVPGGYVIVEIDQYTKCAPGFSTKGAGFKISLPYDDRDTSVCNNTPVPSGYLVVNDGVSNSRCNVLGTNSGAVISPFGQGGDSYTVCDISDIPNGYVVTKIIESDNCSSGEAYLAEEVDPTRENDVCAISPVPAGMVVTKIFDSVECSNYDGWRIKYPDEAVITRVCEVGIEIPPGFEKTGTNTSSSDCDKRSSRSGPSYDIQVSDSSSSVAFPSPFVRSEPNVNQAPVSPPEICSSASANGGFVTSASKNTATRCN